MSCLRARYDRRCSRQRARDIRPWRAGKRCPAGSLLARAPLDGKGEVKALRSHDRISIVPLNLVATASEGKNMCLFAGGGRRRRSARKPRRDRRNVRFRQAGGNGLHAVGRLGRPGTAKCGLRADVIRTQTGNPEFGLHASERRSTASAGQDLAAASPLTEVLPAPGPAGWRSPARARAAANAGSREIIGFRRYGSVRNSADSSSAGICAGRS